MLKALAMRRKICAELRTERCRRFLLPAARCAITLLLMRCYAGAADASLLLRRRYAQLPRRYRVAAAASRRCAIAAFAAPESVIADIFVGQEPLKASRATSPEIPTG